MTSGVLDRTGGALDRTGGAPDRTDRALREVAVQVWRCIGKDWQRISEDCQCNIKVCIITGDSFSSRF